jgi:hypothetical protein
MKKQLLKSIILSSITVISLGKTVKAQLQKDKEVISPSLKSPLFIFV